jgi:hypothetical protein
MKHYSKCLITLAGFAALFSCGNIFGQTYTQYDRGTPPQHKATERLATMRLRSFTPRKAAWPKRSLAQPCRSTTSSSTTVADS